MTAPPQPETREDLGRAVDVELHVRDEDDLLLPFLVWRFASPMQVISSASVGGGVGARSWLINAQVKPWYDRLDLEAHIGELAHAAGLDAGQGVGMLTAANVATGFDADSEGVTVRASVGIHQPVWAAAPPSSPRHAPAGVVVEVVEPDADVGDRGAEPAERVGTINVVAFVPVPHTDAALVNLATTATEAKAQAMVEAGLEGTGTITDTVTIVTPLPSALDRGSSDGALALFGGPRSMWGAPLARAVHAAVAAGIRNSQAVIAQEQAGEQARTKGAT